MKFRNKLKFILLILIIFFLLNAEGVLADNDHNKKAYELYKKAKETYSDIGSGENKDNDKVSEAEELLMQAIIIVANDNGDLSFSHYEKRLIPGRGRWAEYQQVKIEQNVDYFPNRLLSEIRKNFPPQPIAILNFYKKINSILVELTLINDGATSMQDVIFLISNSEFIKESNSIPRIKPGSKKTVKWEISKEAAENLSINFKEKFNYCPNGFHVDCEKFY